MTSLSAPKVHRVLALTIAAAICSASVVRPARADIGSDHPAAILVFPKLLVDTTGGLDTLIRITNVSGSPINVACMYVNTTPSCEAGDGGSSCFPNQPFCTKTVGGQVIAFHCDPQWKKTDFQFRLTQDQPTGWLASGGEDSTCASLTGVCSQDGTTPCTRDGDCGPQNRCIRPPCLPLDGILGRVGPPGQDNVNSGKVPVSPEDPFIGELKCLAVDESGEDIPVARNDLIGEAIIGRFRPGADRIVLAGYNAIGIPAEIDNPCQNGMCSKGGSCRSDSECEQTTGNRDNVLVLGGTQTCLPGGTCSVGGAPCNGNADCPGAAEYEGCPNVLILDLIFDGAVDPLITNACQPDDTCSLTKTACISDNDCVDNVCLAGNTCSVTGTPCMAMADCQNTCVTNSLCAANTCTVGGGPCTSNSDCNNVCRLSHQPCLRDTDCTDAGFRARVGTDLTLVPCTEDFDNQNTTTITSQFLIFNEFEQRLSTSIPVNCFEETRLSSIGTSPGQNGRGIFSVGQEGTLTGQVRISGGASGMQSASSSPIGNGLLGVAEEFRCGGPEYQFPLCSFTNNPSAVVSAAAKNLHFQGLRPVSDYIYLSTHP